jgi:predicted metal-dependent hydrolase
MLYCKRGLLSDLQNQIYIPYGPGLYYNQGMDNTFNSSWLDYTLVRKNIKNIRIRVTGASEVIVSAPVRTAQSRIDGFIRENINKICSSLETIENKRRRFYPADYLNGETFWCLGNKTKLKISLSGRAHSEYTGDTLNLCIPEGYGKTERRALFIGWSKKTADAFFSERLKKLLPGFTKNEFRITAKNMLTRWGSINTVRRTISLSVHLLRCEPRLIDYIITHELCHLKYPDHSKAFYRELESRFPDRKKIDKRLDEYGLVDFN